MRFTLLCSASAVALATAIPASAAVVTFDAGSELATQFNNSSGAGGGWVQEANGGLGNTGSLRVSGSPPSGSDDNEATFNTPYDLGVGDAFVSSILINKTTSGAATGTTRAFQLGFSNGPNVRPFTNSTTPPNGFVSTRVNYAGTATGNYQLEIQHRTSGAGAPVVNTPGSGAGNTPTTLLDNRFYLFSVEITYADSTTGAFDVTASLQDYGADGTTPGATVLSFAPITITNASLTGETLTGLYGGVRSIGNAFGEGTRFDNYTVDVEPVPEPASVALLGVGGLALAARRRRT